MSNINSIRAIKLGTILGYECYIPDSYYNFISFLKPNCPIWIKVTEDGNCCIFQLKRGNAFSEIANFIKTNLEKRHGYYCKKPKGINPLSCQLLDEEDRVCAEILIDDKLNVSKIELGSKEETDWLQTYFLMDYNIKGFESAIIRIPSNYYNESQRLFNVLSDEYGYYIQLG